MLREHTQKNERRSISESSHHFRDAIKILLVRMCIRFRVIPYNQTVYHVIIIVIMTTL